MAWTYVQLFRGRDTTNFFGQFVRVFNDGETPPVPEAGSRLARIEIRNVTAAEVREYLGQGIGGIRLADIPNAVKTQLRETRSYSATAAQLAPYLIRDRNPATLPPGTLKARLLKGVDDKLLPNKPDGTIFIREPGSRVWRCLTDPDTWLEGYVVEDAIASRNLPTQLPGAQGHEFEAVP